MAGGTVDVEGLCKRRVPKLPAQLRQKAGQKRRDLWFLHTTPLGSVPDKISYQIAKSELGTHYKAEIPLHLLCPITHSLMKDPVIVMASGRTYEREREAIDRHMQESRGVPLDPITREPMYVSELTPNHTVRDAVSAWCMEIGSDRHVAVEKALASGPGARSRLAFLIC